jgi:hypothetical protein
MLSESDARIYIGERMECCGNDDSIYDFKTELDSTFISCNLGDERPVTQNVICDQTFDIETLQDHFDMD